MLANIIQIFLFKLFSVLALVLAAGDRRDDVPCVLDLRNSGQLAPSVRSGAACSVRTHEGQFLASLPPSGISDFTVV